MCPLRGPAEQLPGLREPGAPTRGLVRLAVPRGEMEKPLRWPLVTVVLLAVGFALFLAACSGKSSHPASLHWDGSRASLEDQVSKAIPGVAMAQPVPALIDELNAVPEYRERFQKVFGEGITLANIARAIAVYERSLVTYRSPYDRFRAGDRSALSAKAKEGMDLFFDQRTQCASCHSGPLFTDNRWQVLGVPQVGPKAVDNGRFDVTQDEQDRGAFKTPTLRNVELSGHYMHDGGFQTLDEVIAFYAGGGGVAVDKSPLVTPLDLSAKQRAALVAFLRSLTDTSTKIEPPRLP